MMFSVCAEGAVLENFSDFFKKMEKQNFRNVMAQIFETYFHKTVIKRKKCVFVFFCYTIGTAKNIRPLKH